MNAQARKRVVFVTIGQSPRSDVVPEMAAVLGPHVEVHERGALDDLTPEAIAAMAPRLGSYCFATRLRDGRQVELDKAAAEARLAQVMQACDTEGFDVLVPLCTGTAIPPMRTLVIEPQQVVDHALVGLARHCRRIGLLVPLAAQQDSFHLEAELPCETRITHASPYEPDPDAAQARFAQAGRDLSDCDLIVMHCMGYAMRMRQTVTQASARPVLLANRMVAQALAQILE